MEFLKYTKIRFGFKETKTEIFPTLEVTLKDGSTEIIFLSTKSLTDSTIKDQIQIIVAVLTQLNALMDSKQIQNIMNVISFNPINEVNIKKDSKLIEMLEKEPDIYSDKDLKRRY